MKKKRINRFKLNIRKQMKLWRINAYMGTFLVFAMIYMFGNYYFYHAPAKIDYSHLNEYKQEYAEKLIKDLRPEYLATSRKIIFVKDFDDIGMNKWYRNDDRIYIGENWLFMKRIKVYLSGNECYDRNTLAHELLHSIVLNVQEEFYVEDLAKTQVVYKNKIEC